MNPRPHQLRSVEIGDSSDSWGAAGFAVIDGAVRIGSTRIVFMPAGARGITRVSADEIDGTIDGMPFGSANAESLDAAAQPNPPHTNRVIGIDHLVAMSTDVDRTIVPLQSADIELRRERHFGEGDDAKRQAFFWIGDVILELGGLGIARPGDEATLWGLALTCDDLDVAKDTLGGMLSDPKTAVQPGRRIATLRTPRSRHLRTDGALVTPPSWIESGHHALTTHSRRQTADHRHLVDRASDRCLRQEQRRHRTRFASLVLSGADVEYHDVAQRPA